MGSDGGYATNRVVDFDLVQDDKNPRYVDVVRDGRKIYMIDLLNNECTCAAGTFNLPCKHRKEWKERNVKV